MDFLKAYPSVTKEQYMWEWTIPQIRLASVDNTHIVYLTDKQIEVMKSNNYDGNNLEALSDFGVPIFGVDNK